MGFRRIAKLFFKTHSDTARHSSGQKLREALQTKSEWLQVLLRGTLFGVRKEADHFLRFFLILIAAVLIKKFLLAPETHL
jgi:hypothetical protein